MRVSGETWFMRCGPFTGMSMFIECLAEYETASRQLPRPAARGAHKRRPYDWLLEGN